MISLGSNDPGRGVGRRVSYDIAFPPRVPRCIIPPDPGPARRDSAGAEAFRPDRRVTSDRHSKIMDTVRGTTGPAAGSRAAGTSGFTLLEMLIVLVVAGISITFGVVALTGYRARAASEGAAHAFARDLTLARSSARRAREVVVFRFDEIGLGYTLETEAGRQLARRSFDAGSDMALTAIDLELPGDTLVFDERGTAYLGGSSETVGTAVFAAGEVAMEVAFNALGAARVEER